MLRAKPVEPSFHIPPLANPNGSSSGTVAPRRKSGSASSKATATTTATSGTVSPTTNGGNHPPTKNSTNNSNNRAINSSPPRTRQQQQAQRSSKHPAKHPPPPPQPQPLPQQSSSNRRPPTSPTKRPTRPRPQHQRPIKANSAINLLNASVSRHSLRRSTSLMDVPHGTTSAATRRNSHTDTMDIDMSIIESSLRRPAAQEQPSSTTPEWNSPQARARRLLQRAASLPRLLHTKTANLPFMDDSSSNHHTTTSTQTTTTTHTTTTTNANKMERLLGGRPGLGKKATQVTQQAYQGTATAAKKMAQDTARVGKKSLGEVANLVAQNRERRIDGQQGRLSAWQTRLCSPTIPVDLHIQCHHLQPKDSFAPGADAFSVLWQVPCGYGTVDGTTNMAIPPYPTAVEQLVGRTEVVRGCRDPIFAESFRVPFQFQLEQTFVVRVYDEDMRFASDLTEHDYLGGIVFTLGQLLGGKRTLRRSLDNDGSSKLVIRAKESLEDRQQLEFRFSAQDLKEHDKNKVADMVIHKDNPYFKIMRFEPETSSWTCVYKSEVLRNNPSPTWAVSRIPLSVLCHDHNVHAPLQMTLWDYKNRHESQRLGFVETTVYELVQEAALGIPVLPVWKEKKPVFGLVGRNKYAKHKQSMVKILRSVLKPLPTILDYTHGGCELDLILAVDCSRVNGDPNDHSDSFLHHRPKEWLNDYQSAMHKVGVIMESFSNTRNEFSMWGFGGTIDGEEVPYFPIGGNNGNGVVTGTTGMLDAYDYLFDNDPIKMDPTDQAVLQPVIQSAAYHAIQKSEITHSYTVLCILTAGNIADTLETVDAICMAADDSPLSIAIIGVGPAFNFEVLRSVISPDGRHGLRSKMGIPIARDIVKLACFSDFDYGGNASDVVAAAFKDVPEQLVEYYTSSGVDPHPPNDEENVEDFNTDHSDSSGRHSLPGDKLLMDHHRMSNNDGHASMPNISAKNTKTNKGKKKRATRKPPRQHPSFRPDM